MYIPTLDVKESDCMQSNLILIQLIMQSFLSECPPLQKLKMLWTAVFFLRIWRTWMLKSNSYSLTKKKKIVARNVCFYRIECTFYGTTSTKIKGEIRTFFNKTF
jgi:hypothetical protein